jgi:class 3 adenylate cyclase/predicted ATPase
LQSDHHPHEGDAVDIAAWLQELGLGRYEQAFRENEIDARSLPHLTADDLKDMGVTAIGHRRLLLEAITQLGEPPLASDEARPEAASAETSRGKLTGEAERRQLTVLLCDLVGSTALSAKLDPEDMREVIRAYQNTVAGEIGRLEGHVAKFMGDGVLAYFGWPRAHEDEAERAVRAGLALAQTVGQLEAPTGELLAARVSIATGLVVVGDLVGEGAAQEEAVVGETPNLAARLQGLAEPGQIVIAEGTRRLLGDLFDLADLGAQRVKGIAESVRAFVVLGERPLQSRFEAHSGPALRSMVGRDQELALLLERWVQAKSGEGQGVLLVGEAGIGKSRISRALLDALADEPHFRVRYQCSPYHTDSALWPVIQQLSHAAGLGPDDPVEARLDKLETLLDRADRRNAAPLVADLLGLDGGARYGSLNLSPEAQRARTPEALVHQLLGLAARQPVLLVLEDAHWIDPTTLELIEQCLDLISDARVLLLLTSRPDHQPELAAHPHVTRFTLNRLGRAGVEAIIARLGGDHLPTETIGTIIARTDGVPLFVEELTKAILESGEVTIPTSLYDSLMARLDRIPEVKEVAQMAACIGREFAYALLAAIADRGEPDLQSALDKLAAAELIFRRGRPPEATYTFKHSLVQDAAYQSLLRRRRQEFHVRTGRALEQRFPERAASEPELLAHHFTEAGDAEAAVPYWQRAGERAAQRSANLEAIAHLSRGLELAQKLDGTMDQLRRELDMTMALGSASVTVKGWAAPKTLAAFDRARALAERTGDRSHTAVLDWGKYLGHLVRGETDLALRHSQAVLQRVESGGDVTALMTALRCLSNTLVHQGQAAAALPHGRRGLSLYHADVHRPLVRWWSYDARVVFLCFLGHAMLHLGHPDQARTHMEEAVREARRLSHTPSLAYALGQMGWFLQVQDDLPAHAELVEESLALALAHGFSPFRASGFVERGYLRVLSGQTEAGLEEMQQGLREWRVLGFTLTVPLHLTQLAKAYAALRQPEVGLKHVAEALGMIRETGERWHEAEAHRLSGELLLSLPTAKTGAAESAFRKAIEVARSQQAKWPELRAARDLARLWGDQGKRQQAIDLLAPVYGWFTEGFGTADLKDAKALLDELA